jgi:hypothetical protein
MPIGRDRENDFSKRRLPMKSQFLPSYLLKLEILRGRKNFNWEVDISLRYIFLLLVKNNNDLGAVVKAFSPDRRLCKFLFSLYKDQNTICWRSSKRYLK